MIKNISVKSSQKEIDEFLKERYGYGIWNFIYCMYWVATLYNLDKSREEINLLKDKANKLESAKVRLVENIDQFLIDTDIWKGIKRGYPEQEIKWTPKNREKFITKNFNLSRFFKIIDDRIEKINQRIKFLEIYSKFSAKKLRITPRNFVILIWSHVMVKSEKEGDIDFKNISVLLNWFSRNKNWRSFFKSTQSISPKTPELTYNKYIKFSKNKDYHSLSTCLYIDCFIDISDSLINMFPDPFDLVKHEIESKKIMAKHEFEEII
jgi:hypothetical protein